MLTQSARIPPHLEHGHRRRPAHETELIDARRRQVRDAIDRLKELRTALISAAVTGKIDVREEVA